MQIPYVQSGTSTKTQATENTPRKRELEMMKIDLQRPCWNFRPKDRNFWPDAFQMPSSAQEKGSSRNFRPEGPELPPKFRPSSKIAPKQHWIVPQGNWPFPELGRKLAETSGPQDRNFRPDAANMLSEENPAGTSARPELPPPEAGTSAHTGFSTKTGRLSL